MFYIIENNSQRVFSFKTLKELREFAKKNNIKIKKSPLKPNWYYTESYVILPIDY